MRREDSGKKCKIKVLRETDSTRLQGEAAVGSGAQIPCSHGAEGGFAYHAGEA